MIVSVEKNLPEILENMKIEIKEEEIPETSEIEIKEEFVVDPLA
jgi:hypothetical protein